MPSVAGQFIPIIVKVLVEDMHLISSLFAVKAMSFPHLLIPLAHMQRTHLTNTLT